MKKLLPAFAVLLLSLSNLSAAKLPNIMLFLIDDMGVMDTSVPFLTDKNGKPKRYPLNDYYRTQDTGLQQRTKAVAEAKKPLPTDPRLKELEAYLASTQKPLVEDSKLTALKRAVDLSTKQLTNKRLYGAQDIAWALINNPAFLFNH